MYDIENFCIKDKKLPNDWGFSNNKNSDSANIEDLKLGNSFWDNFHDGDKNAERIFSEVNNSLAKFHNMPEEYFIEYVEPPVTAQSILKNMSKEKDKNI